jgi:hypothetical protein
MDKPVAFPASGLAAPGSAVLATLVGSSVWTVYLTPPESGSCQTEAAEPSASKPSSPKLLQETQKLAAAKSDANGSSLAPHHRTSQYKNRNNQP